MTFANAAAEELLGFPASELIGRELHPLIHHSRAEGVPYPIAECPTVAACRGGATQRVTGERRATAADRPRPPRRPVQHLPARVLHAPLDPPTLRAAVAEAVA